MKYNWLLNKIRQVYISADERFLSYNNLYEEVIKVLFKSEDLNKPIIVIKENNYLANRFLDKIKPFLDEEEIVSFLPEESLRSEEIAASYENRADRINALYQILTNKNIKVVVTSSYGFIRHLPNKEDLLEKIIRLKKNETYSKKDLIDNLTKLGYEKTNRVETPMSFASRGYIVDVYSVNYNNPIRIEFFDDEIDSIRFFDINTQRTIQEINSVEIIFAKDVFFSDDEKNYLKENVKVLSGEMELNLEYIYEDIFRSSQYFYYCFFKKQHLKDYFEDFYIYESDDEKIHDHIKFLTDETVSYIQEMNEERKLPLKFYVFGDYDRIIAYEEVIKGQPYKEVTSLVNEVDLPYGNIDYLLNIINSNKATYKLLVLEENEIDEVKEALNRLNISYKLNEIEKGISIFQGYLSAGLECVDLDLIVYAGSDLYKKKQKTGRYINKYQEAITLNSYEELNPGDYVVHDQYGIGQYVAIETRQIAGIKQDYLRIVYKGNDELLVPLNQFKLVRKYVSKEGVIPKLHKLGSKEWIETKRKVEENVNVLAERLVNLYASREENIGFSYSKDTILHKEFEDEFPYNLTLDQAKAIEEVKEDMESSKPMDRLLCGDVGFGKTEVAIRAAFKAIYDKKQVAYLCPTTVLSLQHFNTFKERFSNFPIKVKLINRYVSEPEQKEIIKELKEGKIDVLIGTHRLLSNDIEFKDLGLLIIDEEQRFGVEHKEKIKELKEGVDVLSLSATPIPRTLQMSLIGLRSLSTLNTPPQNRYPVQTYVVNKNNGLIKEVIERELERKGQVFYLYNNTERIYSVARKIEEEVPYASVGVVHGKMNSTDIEDVMVKFYNNEINVLICTTIIETGLDIPNANTIIVENAQNFGLSQLYQIKGRVGRSDRVAYAYLLIPERKQLNEAGQKRLEAIKEFTALGSGYKIAMRDLTIRGAGDLLGPKQSGFIDNVGLDLYLMMLNTAIKQKKGEEVVKEEVKPNLNIKLESYLPEGFNDNDYEKLNLYHELDAIDTKEGLLDYYLKVVDEYGKLPKAVESLFDKKRLELLVNLNYVETVNTRNNMFIVILTEEYSNNIDGLKLFEYCNNLSKDIVINYKRNKLEFSISNQDDFVDLLLDLIEHLDELEKCA